MYACFTSAWAQESGTSFSVPLFRQSVGTEDRSKLLCALLLAYGDKKFVPFTVGVRRGMVPYAMSYAFITFQLS